MPVFSARNKKWGQAVAILFALALVAGLAFYLSHQAGMNVERREARGELQLLSASIHAATDRYNYLPKIVATHPVVIEALTNQTDSQRIQRLNDFLSAVTGDTGADVVYILDKTAMTIAASNWQDRQSFVGHSYAFRPYFQDAMRTGAGQFYAMGIVSLKPGYFISQIIKDKDEVLGVAVVKIDMSGVDKTWTDRANDATVTDENGVIFLSSRADWKYRPTRPLKTEALELMKSNRQYGAVLKATVLMTVEDALGPTEQIIRVAHANKQSAQQASYFVSSAKLAGSAWTINLFMPQAELRQRSMVAAMVAAGCMAFIILGFMYLKQARKRILEREKSRLALEAAHKSLEQQHAKLEQLSRELHIASATDPLTGAYNRRFFLEAVTKLVSAANRHQQSLSIVMIDIDYFKRVNDRYGHAVGDTVLQTLTSICLENLREEDVFARHGGEEFIIALSETGEQGASLVAERIRSEVMAHPIAVNGERLNITISSGVSQYRPNEDGIAATIKRADDALYAAKKNGRNQLAVA